MPFLNQQKGENDHRKCFMIKSPWKNVADPAGVNPATSWSQVRCTSNWATKARITEASITFSSLSTTWVILDQYQTTSQKKIFFFFFFILQNLCLWNVGLILQFPSMHFFLSPFFQTANTICSFTVKIGTVCLNCTFVPGYIVHEDLGLCNYGNFLHCPVIG